MGQWGSRLSAGSRLLEVLEAGHCGENPDANVGWFLRQRLAVMYRSTFGFGGRGRSDEVNSLNQTSLCIWKKKNRVLNMCCPPHALALLLCFCDWLSFVCCCCVRLLWSSQVASSVVDACPACGIMCAPPKVVLSLLLVCPFHSQIVAT